MIKAQNLVAGDWQDNPKSSTYQTVNPKTNKPLPTHFQEASSSQIQYALNKATAVFEYYASTSFKARIQLLKAIEKGLNLVSEELLQIYQDETALPKVRAEGELQRTIDQIQRFEKLLIEGSFLQPIINTKGPDIRKILHPIGPIAVFGASNFPLAFSTAGGDTISVFASGCPLIMKAHPYHAGTSAVVAQVIHKAIDSCGLPKEIFSHLGGTSNNVGMELINNPLLKGVGFTGSLSGGKSLYDLAQKRAEPIPFFAEMGSINPIFITEKRLATDKNIAKILAESIALGTGQFCTNPGMIIFCNSQDSSDIVSEVSQYLNKMTLSPMLHSNIEKRYLQQLKEIRDDEAVSFFEIPSNIASVGKVSAASILNNKKYSDEVFGPFSLFVECKSMDEIQDIIDIIPGQLTGTILSHKDEYFQLLPLISKLKNRVGRLLFDGVPTGVAVTQAMHHGGPYPATTDGRYTSVGIDAIYRWLRPVAFQDCPNKLLPLALQNENPLGLYRSINGQLTKEVL